MRKWYSCRDRTSSQCTSRSEISMQGRLGKNARNQVMDSCDDSTKRSERVYFCCCCRSSAKRVYQSHSFTHFKYYRSNYLFDLGASRYRYGIGGSSLDWLVETFRSKSVEFDRIFAWEAKVLDQNVSDRSSAKRENIIQL